MILGIMVQSVVLSARKDECSLPFFNLLQNERPLGLGVGGGVEA